MSKAGKKHRAYWEEEAGRRVAARLGSEVPTPEEVEVEVEDSTTDKDEEYGIHSG